jgi:hypothetical protein
MKTGNDGDVFLGMLPGGTQVMAAAQDHGQALLTSEDAFVEAQSRFDRQARVNLTYDIAPVTLPMYFDYVSSQVLPWSPAEIGDLQKIIVDIAHSLLPLNVPFPPVVILVKTTGLEEGYAAYTRKDNVIVLPENMVASLQASTGFNDPLHPGTSTAYLQAVVTHELFHILSKNNPVVRARLYGLVNYRVMGNTIVLPEVPWGPTGALLTDLKITNPDTPALDVYINMLVPATPGGEEGSSLTRSLLPILLASGPYQGGIFFNYLQWLFMAVQQNDEGVWTPLVNGAGIPLIYDSTPLVPQYLSLVGRNFTSEIFHPDEILAQSFVLIAQQPSLDLLGRVGAALSRS